MHSVTFQQAGRTAANELPRGWELLGSPATARPDWLRALFIEAIESIVVAAPICITSVDCLGAKGLTDIGKRVVDDHADRLGRIRVTDRTLEGFENAIDESLGRRTPGPG